MNEQSKEGVKDRGLGPGPLGPACLTQEISLKNVKILSLPPHNLWAQEKGEEGVSLTQPFPLSFP